jgi:xanthine dehydrogenase iron-sulfur cluster and FAD-binding subunit A
VPELVEQNRSKDLRQLCQIELTINGRQHNVTVATTWTLNDVLRNVLDLTGTKKACDYGGCGSCTVLINVLPAHNPIPYRNTLPHSMLRSAGGARQE